MKTLLMILAVSFSVSAEASRKFSDAEVKFYGSRGSALDQKIRKNVKVCGELTQAETNYTAQEATESYYQLQVDCNWDGQATERRWLLLAGEVVNPLTQKVSSRKGWATRYQREARAERGSGARPYLCVQAEAQVHPCSKKNRVQKIETGFYRMTSQVEDFYKLFKPRF